MNILQNKLWPNTDGNLGKIKVQIPAGTVDDPWPEGDALVGNFVYKSGKLVGFIDVAALIPNESGETNIPYDTIDTKFPGILKDSFIINAGERCKYQFAKLEEDIAVYTSTRLFEIMDADKFKVSYDKDENKVTVSLSLDTTAAQIAEVKSLLDRVLPRNLLAEVAELPLYFTPLEYIENRSTAFIRTDNKLTDGFDIESEYSVVDAQYGSHGVLIGYNLEPQYLVFCTLNDNTVRFDYGNSTANTWRVSPLIDSSFSLKITGDTAVFNNITHNKSWTLKVDSTLTEFETSETVNIFSGPRHGAWFGKIKLYSLKGSRGDVPQFNFLPALGPTGAPCLFDTVSRKYYYSSGGDDFYYPGKVEEAPAAASYSLRAPRRSRPEYAKDTGRGIARLYRVPAGYEGGIDEYAAANGYKWLVENEQPAEGYWVPQWRETEEQLILDWVETEPPTEIIE